VQTNLEGDGSVLVIDDESCVRKLAEAVLRKYGYTVLVAEDAVAAIDLLGRTTHKIAVALLDLSMPGMSAEEAIQRIHHGWPATRILLSSGYDEEEVSTRFTGAPLAGFVQKPYTPAQLAEKIKAAMGLWECGDRDPIRSSQIASCPEHGRKACSISPFAA
jgi:two-component system cell cycle sensor histidine kinase/response regulator CckA